MTETLRTAVEQIVQQQRTSYGRVVGICRRCQRTWHHHQYDCWVGQLEAALAIKAEPLPSARGRAEVIVRNHEKLCKGIWDAETAYCSTVLDEPFCEACGELVDAIEAALAIPQPEKESK